MRHRNLLLLGLITFLTTGCAVHMIHKDHDQIRTTLLDLYTNQVMDNLVRTHNRMPIIQLDYTQATGMVTIANTIGGSDSQVATTNVFSKMAAASSALRSIATTLGGTLSNSSTNQVTLAATPLITSNEVYDAYLEFLEEPGSLMVTCVPPPPGQAHICKESNGMYYWVPTYHRDLFFRLSLLTTSQRGKTLKSPDDFFTTVATYVTDDPGTAPSNREVTLKLKDNIPTDDGYLVLADGDDDDADAKDDDVKKGDGAKKDDTKKDDGAKKDDAAKDKKKDKDKDGKKSYPILHIKTGNLRDKDTVISILVGVKELKLFTAAPRKVKIYLTHERPKKATTNELLDRTNFQLQQIQFNQLRPSR